MVETSAAAAVSADAMSVAEVLAEVKAIARICGPNAYVGASVSISRHSSGRDNGACVAVYPDDLTNSRSSEQFSAATWREALDAARTWALSQGTVQREAAIRRMALLIIDLTDQHGECTEAMLVRHDLTSAQVRELHSVACERASEMCQRAPFTVKLA